MLVFYSISDIREDDIKQETEHESSLNMEFLPRKGDFIYINDDEFEVSSVSWNTSKHLNVHAHFPTLFLK